MIPFFYARGLFPSRNNLLISIIVLQFIVMVEFAFQFCMRLVTIQWDTSRVLRGGVLFRAWKKFCSLSSVC